KPSKIRETFPEISGLSTQSQSEMVWHSEETTFRDDGPVLLEQSIREFPDVHLAVGEHHAPARGDAPLERRHLVQRLRGDFPVRVEDPLRPPKEEIPPAESPGRNRLGED